MGAVIVDYDPAWPDQFEQLAAGLRRHLGEAVLAIDHVGSTAVPGLAAKDIIDLQVTVASLAEADRLAPPSSGPATSSPRTGWTTGRPVTRATPGRGGSACGSPRPGPAGGSTPMSASPAARTGAMRSCSVTTCGPIRVPLAPMSGSSWGWPSAWVTTSGPTPSSRTRSVT